ncbi:MAG TPA: tetratricopeptide repeat protein [Pyrinomonadaceae bacterium]
MKDPADKTYGFGPFVLDARRRLLLRDGDPVQLTPKALDLLVALVERRGRVVEKDELLRVVWPDQFVEEANLSVNMSALRKALGERASENQFVATVPRRGYRFVAEVRELEEEGAGASRHAERDGEAEFEAWPALGAADGDRRATGDAALSDGVPNNLPIQLTPFVGRRAETDAVERLLRRADMRLLTLTGPGGSGKTRLALNVAARLVEEFPDGVFFVELEPISDPALVISTIEQTLGVKEAGGTTLAESLKKYLRSRRVLLVLDNFEQIVAAAPLVSSLLTGTLHLKVVVTSRAVLRVSGEHEFQVPPLLLPNVKGLPRAQELLQYSSVELFVQRAVAAKSDFLLTERNAQAVAEICVQLDGLPLAIELAAARVRLLPPQAMVARLEAPFKLLIGGARNLPPRQQTMSGAIAWSYDLLNDAEKRLFRRLSAFVGGATLESIAAVCDCEAQLGGDVHDGVAALVDNSLLRQVEQAGGEPRFVMLETIREYGVERLKASGEAGEVRRRHARFFVELVEKADPELGGEQLGHWLEQLEREHDNLRAALRWALDSDDAETGLRLVRSLWWFWYLHGYYGEGRGWVNKVLGCCGQQATPHRARALVGAGVLAFLPCDYEAAEKYLNEGLELSKGLGERETTAMALQVLGSVARERGDYERAVARHQESLAIWRELGDVRGIARSLNYVGFAAWLRGDFEQTVACCEVARGLFREQGDKEGLVWSLLSLAAVAHYTGDATRSLALCDDSMALSREIGYKEGVAWALDIAGNTERAAGRGERARAMLQESLHLHHELGDRWRVASLLESLGALAEGEGRHERGARLFGAAERVREEVGTPPPAVERDGRAHHLSALRAALGGHRLDVLLAAGRTTTPELSVAYALELDDRPA